MRIACIDIGTNTALLLIADIDGHDKIRPLEHQQRFPRIGKEVDKNLLISPSAFKSAEIILQDYKNRADHFNVDKTIVCATSAIRDSTNKNDFIAHIKNTTGLDVEIISGDEEALLAYKGAVSGLALLPSNMIVLDIGGGSTEISFRANNKFISDSFQLGAVRLTERFIQHNPPTSDELSNTRKVIIKDFHKLDKYDFTNYSLIGVAGTVTTLTCLDQDLMEFNVQKVSGYRLSLDRVKHWLDILSKKKSSEIRLLSKSTEGREDILSTGVLILYEFMRQLEFKEIVVSERGLRYGMVSREWEKQFNI
jgi:exopolyphosphatase/guanosine-5'-triphosphate,3'-diphosphate pyrophosphatase